MRFEGLTVDLLKREELAGTQAVTLTSIEFKLLVALTRTPGKPLSRNELSEAVQRDGYKPLDRTVDVQVARLRRKRPSAPGACSWE